MVQRWVLHHKAALAVVEGDFSCWCYTNNVSPTFRVPGVGRTQKFPKLAIWVLFKKRVSFAVKGTEVNWKWRRRAHVKGHLIPKNPNQEF